MFLHKSNSQRGRGHRRESRTMRCVALMLLVTEMPSVNTKSGTEPILVTGIWSYYREKTWVKEGRQLDPQLTKKVEERNRHHITDSGKNQNMIVPQLKINKNKGISKHTVQATGGLG